jgi:hypothetical protein
MEIVTTWFTVEGQRRRKEPRPLTDFFWKGIQLVLGSETVNELEIWLIEFDQQLISVNFN